MIDPRTIALEYAYSSEVEDKLKLIKNAELKETYRNNYYKSKFFKTITARPTPLRYIQLRKGSFNKETKKFRYLEYFGEEYTMHELDELFSGWWMEDMQYNESQRYPTGTVSGYLVAEYPTLNGIEIVKRFAVASAKQDTKENGDFMNVDDLEKKALTEWYKIAGKRLGFGFDLYHQRITVKHWDMLKQQIANIPSEYIKEIIEKARLYESGQKFRQYMKSLPFAEQIESLITSLKSIEGREEWKKGVWDTFLKMGNTNHTETLKLENFLEKLRETIKQTKENNNE